MIWWGSILSKPWEVPTQPGMIINISILQSFDRYLSMYLPKKTLGRERTFEAQKVVSNTKLGTITH